MRSHCAVYIDAGYLIAAAATRVTGTSLRGGVDVDHESIVNALIEHSVAQSGLPLLRVHWYDSSRNAVPDPVQQRIALLPKVKVRLGRIGYDGEQKGVDLRIGLDLVAHARNGAVESIFLVSGDDDLTEAVEEAQAHGVQVTIVAVPNSDGTPQGVSAHLHRASDGLDLIDAATIDAAVTKRVAAVRNIPLATASAPTAPAASGPSPASMMKRMAEAARAISKQSPSVAPSPTRPTQPEPVYSSTTGHEPTGVRSYVADEADELMDEICARVLRSWRASATPEELRLLPQGKPSIPREIDRALLRDLSEALDIYDLDDDFRFRLRARFWEQDGI